MRVVAEVLLAQQGAVRVLLTDFRKVNLLLIQLDGIPAVLIATPIPLVLLYLIPFLKALLYRKGNQLHIVAVYPRRNLSEHRKATVHHLDRELMRVGV